MVGGMKDISLPFEQRNLPREYDKTKKVLPLSQTVNILTRTNETLYLCDICNEKYKSWSGLKLHQKNCTQSTRIWILLHPWKTH